jgi:hypothetical protein
VAKLALTGFCPTLVTAAKKPPAGWAEVLGPIGSILLFVPFWAAAICFLRFKSS